MGFGDGRRSDEVAVESMRRELARLPMAGRIVIGEGERSLREVGERHLTLRRQVGERLDEH